MSYDLDFWLYEDESARHDHLGVYERLSDGETVEGVREIPVARILERLASVCSAAGWTSQHRGIWEGRRGSFQVYTTAQLFRVDCYGMQGEDMNVLIDIALEFGLPLYDPQVGERFAAPRSAAPEEPQSPVGGGGLRARLRGWGRRGNG